ncbi:hypothetical protein [Microvirga sp. Mcv34]|uniref:hypothetical protein n=1 Tax=Microvirga sp. Mcv34 TaxID=2926016 RepID=UPI0021C9E0AA|nr:hypothetical protein [Microvirga sp. Mcv34]
MLFYFLNRMWFALKRYCALKREEAKPVILKDVWGIWESYEPTENLQSIKLTDRHLALIRRTRFGWNMANDTVEVGAPCVDASSPYGSGNILSDIAEVFGAGSPAELALQHARMAGILNLFFQSAQIDPGHYDIGGQDFNLTTDHIILARCLPFFWKVSAPKLFKADLWPVPSCDPVRPYGLCSYFERDMAACLGWLGEDDSRELSDDEFSKLTQMHTEMADVFQVMAAYARIEAEV